MRTITKERSGGYQLSQAHANPPQTPQQATSRWHNFRHKEPLLAVLLEEQYHLCCYSELRADQEGLGYHIEHVENKSQNPLRTFDYANLAASALDSLGDLSAFAAQGQEVFGGHAVGKRQAVDHKRFISCHQPDCQRFFAYLSDGRVVPKLGLTALERDRAQYTIDTLNLNSPFLVTRRRQWWDELDLLYQQHLRDDWSLPDLAAIDLLPTAGKLSRFFSLTRQFFGPIGEQVLHQQAPALL